MFEPRKKLKKKLKKFDTFYLGLLINNIYKLYFYKVKEIHSFVKHFLSSQHVKFAILYALKQRKNFKIFLYRNQKNLKTFTVLTSTSNVKIEIGLIRARPVQHL